MKWICIVSIFILTAFSGLSQEAFSGVLKYKATVMAPDTNKVWKSWNVTLYTNDTVVRVETETEQFGVQVYIRNMLLNKAY